MVDPIQAEARAVESGAHAMQQEDGTFRVRSFSRDDVRHTVRPGLLERHGRWAIHLACTCESGAARPAELVPCQHAALVGRRLARIGWARWDSGFWWATDAALRAVGIETPRPRAPRIAKGACPVCRSFLSVAIKHDDEDVRELAAAHRPECLETYRKRVAAAKDAPQIDLWDRS